MKNVRKMLKVCVVVDVEDFISFRGKNPEWGWWQNLKIKINGLIAPLRYEKKGYDKIYSLVVKEKFPVSFMLVGSFFKPKEKHDFIDYGYHSWSHKPLTYINDNEMNKEIKNIYGCVSFSASMELIEDPIAPGRVLKALKEQGYKVCVWAGPTIRDRNGKLIIIKEPRKKIAKPIKNYIKCVYVSNFFEGNSNKEHIKNLIKEIKESSGKEAVYCITTHDFTHKKSDNLRLIIRFLKDMRERKLIKIVNLAQL